MKADIREFELLMEDLDITIEKALSWPKIAVPVRASWRDCMPPKTRKTKSRTALFPRSVSVEYLDPIATKLAHPEQITDFTEVTLSSDRMSDESLRSKTTATLEKHIDVARKRTTDQKEEEKQPFSRGSSFEGFQSVLPERKSSVTRSVIVPKYGSRVPSRYTGTAAAERIEQPRRVSGYSSSNVPVRHTAKSAAAGRMKSGQAASQQPDGGIFIKKTSPIRHNHNHNHNPVRHNSTTAPNLESVIPKKNLLSVETGCGRQRSGSGTSMPRSPVDKSVSRSPINKSLSRSPTKSPIRSKSPLRTKSPIRSKSPLRSKSPVSPAVRQRWRTLDEARKKRRLQREGLSTQAGLSKLANIENLKYWVSGAGEGRRIPRQSGDFQGSRAARFNSSPLPPSLRKDRVK
eukprot:TRINITY_DN5802_c0_g1_i1.p1 TRINITY_DN5802_c0_g1~~TRINITY_DN5802_c0_g1_i1.p1  ORF type:complete len:441 (+),score=66.96 TRINITY_DN5802_c0_g1_i1:117-1325(+)